MLISIKEQAIINVNISKEPNVEAIVELTDNKVAKIVVINNIIRKG